MVLRDGRGDALSLKFDMIRPNIGRKKLKTI